MDPNGAAVKSKRPFPAPKPLCVHPFGSARIALARTTLITGGRTKITITVHRFRTDSEPEHENSDLEGVDQRATTLFTSHRPSTFTRVSRTRLRSTLGPSSRVEVVV
jgi:hypothetical protein